jgi:hypothetical protein
MANDKILFEIPLDTPRLDPMSIVPKPSVLEQPVSENTSITEPIVYNSQDTETSLKPFKIDRVHTEQDGSTSVYYTISIGTAATETEMRTTSSTGMINVAVYDKDEVDRQIFEILINSGRYL